MPLKQTTGSRCQVMHGTAKKTTGGLTKSQLKYNKQGKIVSKKASALAKKNNRLVKAGTVPTPEENIQSFILAHYITPHLIATYLNGKYNTRNKQEIQSLSSDKLIATFIGWFTKAFLENEEYKNIVPRDISNISSSDRIKYIKYIIRDIIMPTTYYQIK